jgi:hypothetical protein
MADLFNNLFNGNGLKIDDSKFKKSENSNEFKPNYSKGKNGTFTAVVRFLPNPHVQDPSKDSIVMKYNVYLKNPITNSGRYVDSPSTIGADDPLSQMYFQLYNSNNAQAKKVANDFKRSQNFYSIIQVVDCQDDPSLVNKILVWRYGKKIYEKLEQEMTPAFEGAEPNYPFDLFSGRLFKVIATKQNDYNNLDQSLFIQVNYPQNCMRVLVPGDPNSTDPNAQKASWQFASREMASTPEGQQLIFNYLKDNSVDITKYKYKDWDADTKKYVEEMIILHSQILSGKQPQATTGGIQTAPQGIASVNAATVGTAPAAPAAPAAPGGMPSLSGMMSQSAAPAAPAPAPIAGLTMGGDMPTAAPTAAPAAPAQISGLDMSGINDAMNASHPATPASDAQPSNGGLSPDFLKGLGIV